MIERAYALLSVTATDGVATLTLDNPARRNAIGPRMVNELLYALEDAAEDEAIRVVVLTGAGDRAFCAGGDFSSMTGGDDTPDELPPKGDYAALLQAMHRYPKPIVARVNGHAMGGGLGLVAASHFAVAVRGAKLGTPEVNVGLFPMMIMAVLKRHVPWRRLQRMMLLGERLQADDAKAVGLVGDVVDDHAALDATVSELTAQLKEKSPITLRLGLEAMADQADLSLDEALPMLQERLALCLATEDAQEGLMAFLQKRPPQWKGR